MMTGLRPPLFGFLPIFFASLRSLLPPSLAPFLLALLAINPAAAAAAGVTSEDRGGGGAIATPLSLLFLDLHQGQNASPPAL